MLDIRAIFHTHKMASAPKRVRFNEEIQGFPVVPFEFPTEKTKAFIEDVLARIDRVFNGEELLTEDMAKVLRTMRCDHIKSIISKTGKFNKDKLSACALERQVKFKEWIKKAITTPSKSKIKGKFYLGWLEIQTLPETTLNLMRDVWTIFIMHDMIMSPIAFDGFRISISSKSQGLVFTSLGELLDVEKGRFVDYNIYL